MSDATSSLSLKCGISYKMMDGASILTVESFTPNVVVIKTFVVCVICNNIVVLII